MTFQDHLRALAERAGAQRNLLNRFTGQLYHCLQTRQLFDENRAFASLGASSIATAA